jgi:diacylglycerol O-acyltransferase
MKRLSGSDALFLSMETASWHQHIAGLTILDPSQTTDFSLEKMVSIIEQRMPLSPKFHWKLKTTPLNLDRPVWVDDDEFDIWRHIRRIGVPSPGGVRETSAMLAQIMSYQLDRNIPMWEFWYLEGLENGRVGFILKFHHALLDGVSGASLATVLMDLAPDADPPEIPDEIESPGRNPSQWELLARSTVPVMKTPFNMVRYAGEALRRGVEIAKYQARSDVPQQLAGMPRTRWNHKIGPRRTIATASVSFEDIKATKTHHGVKVNDVVLAICSGALRGYLEMHGELPDNPLVAGVPISTRADDDTEMDNKIANMNVGLGTHLPTAVERLERIHTNSQASKEMTNAVLAKKIQSIGETAPPIMLNAAIQAIYATGSIAALPTMLNLVISNVPGPPFPIYFGGARVTGMFPGSVIVEGTGLNITVFSYEDRLDFGLAADIDLVPDLWSLAELIPDALAQLMEESDLGKPTPVVDAFG